MSLIQVMILGTTGNSQDILDTINDINSFSGETVYECIGFLDDNEKLWGHELSGVQVHGPLADAKKHTLCFFINGIGNPYNFYRKEKILSQTGVPLERFTTIIHPTASISKTATIGTGVVVFQHVTITTNVAIGNHVIILPNTVISHDAIIGHYTTIAGGAYVSGCVTIGDSCYLGARSALNGNISIGDDCLIGMGAIVLNSLEPNLTVVGNPARFLRKTIEE